MTEKEFLSEWYKIISSEGLKNFPADFISTDKITSLSLPPKTLVIGSELFGNYEITTIEGEPVLQANSYHYTKYILYANRNKPVSINIPVDDNAIKHSVNSYEIYLDSIIKRIETDFKKRFPNSQEIYTVVNQICNKLNITRL